MDVNGTITQLPIGNWIKGMEEIPVDTNQMRWGK
jgi:hypothetical protein